MSDWDEILQKFLRYWDGRVRNGLSSCLSKTDLMLIKIFLDWLTHTYRVKIDDKE